jgi:transposase InsO family protein
MQESRRQSKRIAESGTGGVLETVKALLPKTRRAPAAAKKPAPAAPAQPEQPQLAREPAAPQTPLEKELHRLYYDYKFYVGRDKLYWLMQQQQQKAAAAGQEFPYFSHRLIQSWLSKQELSQLFRPIRNPIKSRSTTASAPFKQIAMDLTSLFSNETDQRYKWILTAIDLFTKKGWAVPMTNKDTASIHAAFEQMLRKITRNGEQRIGSLRTDNGSEFKSDFIKSYLGDKGIKQVFSNAYTPQSNGQVEKWNGILKRLIYMNLHKNQKYDWVEDLERLVGNYNDAWQSAIKTSPNLAEKGALEDAPPPGQSDTDMGGEFGLNSKGRTMENIKKSKEGVVGNTKVVFKVGDRVRIAIEAIKPLKQRDVALQSNIDRIKWTKEIYEVRQVSIPKNGIAAPYYYLEGKYDKQQFYSQELQGVDAVEAPTEVAVRYIISDLIYPLVKEQPAALPREVEIL